MSDLDAIRALGERLRAAGSPPAAQAAPRPYAASDVQAGLERLRAFAAGEPTDDQAAYLARRYAGRGRGMSGWRQAPQCGGCKRLLKRPDATCPSCGYVNGGGYMGVPASTSHLERWR
jgi:hypothetical protein